MFVTRLIFNRQNVYLNIILIFFNIIMYLQVLLTETISDGDRILRRCVVCAGKSTLMSDSTI